MTRSTLTNAQVSYAPALADDRHIHPTHLYGWPIDIPADSSSFWLLSSTSSKRGLAFFQEPSPGYLWSYIDHPDRVEGTTTFAFSAPGAAPSIMQH